MVPLSSLTLITTVWQELCCVLLPLIFYLSKYTRFHIKRAAVTSWRCVCVCMCGMGASTAKAKQAALIWHDLRLPLIISLGVRSWVWLLRTLILNGPSACSLIITHWAAVDGITELLDLVLTKWCKFKYRVGNAARKREKINKMTTKNHV